MLFFLYCDRGLKKDDDERERENTAVGGIEGKSRGGRVKSKKDIHKRLSVRKGDQRKVIFIIGVLPKIL